MMGGPGLDGKTYVYYRKIYLFVRALFHLYFFKLQFRIHKSISETIKLLIENNPQKNVKWIHKEISNIIVYYGFSVVTQICIYSSTMNVSIYSDYLRGIYM